MSMIGQDFDQILIAEREIQQSKDRIEYLESEIAKLGKFILNADLGFPRQDEARYPMGMTPVDSAIEYIHHVQENVLGLLQVYTHPKLVKLYDEELKSLTVDVFKELLKADWHEAVAATAAKSRPRECPTTRLEMEDVFGDQPYTQERNEQSPYLPTAKEFETILENAVDIFYQTVVR